MNENWVLMWKSGGRLTVRPFGSQDTAIAARDKLTGPIEWTAVVRDNRRIVRHVRT